MRLRQAITVIIFTLSLTGTAFAADAGKKEEPKKEEAKKEEPKKEDSSPVKATVPYPTGYRDWRHIKSMVIFSPKHPLHSAFGGIHHIYGNAKAIDGIKTQKEYPNGSVFVLDLLEATEQDGAYSAGKRKFIGVMHRDTKKYSETNGWGWELFEAGDPNQRSVKTVSAAKACATCHTDVFNRRFVFAELKD